MCCQDELLETDDKYYEVSETSLKDKSMLGTHGQQLCDNVDVHWMIQTCTATNATGRCIPTVVECRPRVEYTAVWKRV